MFIKPNQISVSHNYILDHYARRKVAKQIIIRAEIRVIYFNRSGIKSFKGFHKLF